MAITTIDGHILFGLANDPNFQINTEMQEHFSERFPYCEFQEQYDLMAFMFGKLTDIQFQPWLLNLANQMIKTSAKGFSNSQFKNNHTMVEFFIKNFSYGETESLRRSIWAIIK